MTTPAGNNDPEGEGLLPLSALNDLLYCERRCWLHRVAGVDEDNAYTLLGSFDHERADEPSVETRPGVRMERALPLVSRGLGIVGRADVVEFRRGPVGAACSRDFSRDPADPARVNREAMPGDHGNMPGDHGDVPEERGNIPEDRGDVPEERGNAPGDRGNAPGDRGNMPLLQEGRAPTDEVPYPIDYKHGPKRKWSNDDVQLCAQAMCLEEMLGVAVPAGAIFHVGSKRRREVAFTEGLREQVRRAAAELHRLLRTTEPPAARMRPQCEGCSMHRHCLPEAGEAGERIRHHLKALFES